jgi:signal transduction histidine kinase/DNA-binding response OmpR family regulator
MRGESPDSLSILLVEDHPDQAELTRRALERQLPGSAVTVADRGAACLKRLDDAAYDLLVLDYSLPDINGLALLREIKARGHHLPVVMVTGQGDERIAVEAMKGGAADYIIKTGSYLTALPAVIQRAIEQDRLQRELAAVQAEVIKRNKELTDLHTLASTLSGSLRLADLLPLALDVILASVEADCGGIYLHRPERDEFILSAHRGLGAAALESFPERVSAGEGVIGRAAFDRKTISMDGLMAAPFSAKGFQTGVLFVGRSQGVAFSPEQERLLELMGNQVGAAAENSRLYARAETRARRLAALNEVSRKLSATWRLDDLLPGIAEAAARLLQVEAVGFRLLEGDELVIAGMSGEADKVMSSVPRLKLEESLSGQAVVERRPVQYADLEEAPSCLESIKSRARAAGFSSALAVPILSGDRGIGALCLFTRERREFTLEEISLLSTFTDQAAVAIENARLYKETARALEDLQRTQGQLIQAEKLRALGEMAGGVAHDFNNLLAIILGRAQYLRLRQGEMTPEEAQRCLGIIERASLDGAETIRRLMSFTRTAPGSQEPEAMNPNEVLDYVAEASRPRWKDEAEAKGKQIQMTVEKGDVPWMEGHASEIIEVMLNLVFNAIEAMPQGGRLTLRSWTENGSVCLSVQDTGVGMPEEVVRKIFEPFFTTKGPQRSGLGLSVSYGIIRRHGGELQVESRPGKGTTFTIRLPNKPAMPRQAKEVPAPPQVRLRILVADDEADVREMLSDILQSGGHTVFAAEDGAEAIETLARERVDLVCTDLGMPGMSGWEVAERVRERWPDLKVALITGWEAQIEPEDLEAHGVDLLIAKPFQVKEILHAVAELGSLSGGNGGPALRPNPAQPGGSQALKER